MTSIFQIQNEIPYMETISLNMPFNTSHTWSSLRENMKMTKHPSSLRLFIDPIRRGVGPRESLSPLIKLNTTGRTGRAYRKAGNLKLTNQPSRFLPNQPSRFATLTTPSLLFINSFPAFISRHKP
jgi:hypothetical protein